MHNTKYSKQASSFTLEINLFTITLIVGPLGKSWCDWYLPENGNKRGGAEVVPCHAS